MYKNFKLPNRLKTAFIIAGIMVAAGFVGTKLIETNPIDYVNPFVGTDAHGHTFPAAALPGGMVQLGPDTGIVGWDWSSGYHYSDSSIMGFSHLHRSGMGAGDWGDILLMPTTGKLKIVPGDKLNPDEGYRSTFTHKEEEASPGYYAVNLKDYKIKAELTVSERVGFHKYTFPKSDDSHILIDMKHGIHDDCTAAQIKIINDTEIEGHRASNGFVKNQKVYFYAKFSKPFSSFGTWNKENIKSGSKEESGQQIGVFVNYVTSENETVEVKVGISYTSIAQARLNLDKEMPHWDFDRVKENAKQTWGKALSKIEVDMGEGNDEAYNKEKMATFYTAMYHSLLFPATFNDVDGKYTGMDGKIHTAKDFTYSSDFSLWDTYRAQMPLLTLIEPQRNSDAINTMIAQYEQGEWLPAPQQFGNDYTNDMIGDHHVGAIVDAYMKGIRNYDVEKAYEAIRKNATEMPPAEHRSRGRVALDSYMKYGYIPYEEIRGSVSRTLEYAYNDWCVAQFAKELGKESDYDMFMKRAAYYKNIMDKSTRLARPKDGKGLWLKSFNPSLVGNHQSSHYTEGNAWQYTWFVPHDVQGLIDFEGGKEKFNEKLDSLFTISSDIGASNVADVTGFIGQYAHGNEPSHHTIYLYNYAGAPWKAQNMVRNVMENLYDAGPAGLCGNEDMGQMSAWYIFSAMGFYPVTPGQSTYVIGSPLFRKTTINLGESHGNNKFIVEALNVSKDNKYIQSATLNGRPLLKPWITHNEIVNGGKLEFEMGAQPNIQWGASIEAAPPSMKQSHK